MADGIVGSGNELFSAEPSSYLKPERRASISAKRKQSLRGLLSDLLKLTEETESESGDLSSIYESEGENSFYENEIRDRFPTFTTNGFDYSEDFQSREGVANFRAFEKHVSNLNRQLQAFANAVARVGSSARLLNATCHLRDGLFQIENLLRENAAELFPEVKRKINRAGIHTKIKYNRVQMGARQQRKPQKDLEQLPTEMDLLEGNIRMFVTYLNDILGYEDELVNASFRSFADDLKYRASCLREHEGQMETAIMRRYINDLSIDIGMHLDEMERGLDDFIKVDVPTIRDAQSQAASSLHSLSAMATLFSGVTATTIQMSSQQTGSSLADLVNALWFTSLFLSIASAINSQLAYHWRAAIYRSPRDYLPWWVETWLHRSPAGLLIGSMMAFCLGLCGRNIPSTVEAHCPDPSYAEFVAFTYSSNQNRAVSSLVLALTTLASTGLVSVGLWFVFERWIFSSTQGQSLLYEELREAKDKIYGLLGIDQIQHLKNTFQVPTSWLRDDPEMQAPVRPCTCTDIGSCNHDPGPHSDPAASSFKGDMPYERNAQYVVPEFAPDISPDSIKRAPRCLSTIKTAPALPQPRPVDKYGSYTERWKSAVKRVMAINRVTKRSSSPGTQASSNKRPSARREGYSESSAARSSQLRGIKPKVDRLQVIQHLNEHTALVKHMQFNPSGDFLATSSWDRTTIIWRIGEKVEQYQIPYYLSSAVGFVHQIAWSPDGSKLMTRTQDAIKIWDTRTAKGQECISRPHSIESASWMPSGNRILLAEYIKDVVRKKPTSEDSDDDEDEDGEVGVSEEVTGTNLVLLDINGKIVRMHRLERIKIWDMAVMLDEDRVVAVATLVKSRENLQPTQSRAEKRTLVYNMKTERVEHCAPLLREVRGVSLCVLGEKSTFALVSYEDKSPPQLWRVDMIKKEGKSSEGPVANLTLSQSYYIKSSVDFVGSGFFGGPDNTLVYCPSKAGELYIWDRKTGALLTTLQPKVNETTQTFACNSKEASEFKVVSGTVDGGLNILSPKPPTEAPDILSVSPDTSTAPRARTRRAVLDPVLESADAVGLTPAPRQQ